MRAGLSRRQFLHLSASAAAGMALAACQPVGTTTGNEGAQPSTDEVVLTHMNTPQVQERLGPIFDRFAEEHPGVTVEAEYVVFSAMFEKLQTLAAAGDVPDTFFTAAGWVRELERLGILSDLRPVFDTLGGLDPEKYMIEALQAVSTEDKVWAIPFAIHYTYLFYNSSLFDDAGISYPDESWTWEDLRQAATALTKSEGDTVTQWGFASRPGYEGLEPAIFSNGGEIFSGFDQVVFDSPENVATVQWWVDLIHKDRVSPVPSEYAQLEGGDINYLASGKVGMIAAGGWACDTLRTQDVFEWGMSVLPQGSEGRVHIFWPDSWAIANTSQNKELGVQLLLEMATDPNGVTYYTLPFVKSVMDDPVWRQEDTLPANRIETMLAASATARPGVEMTTYRWTEWYNTWVNELTFAFIGERDVPTSVTAAAEAMQAIVDNI